MSFSLPVHCHGEKKSRKWLDHHFLYLWTINRERRDRDQKNYILSSLRVTDAPIDAYGSLYAAEKVPSVYDLLGITGESVSIGVSSFIGAVAFLQFGDK